VEPEWNENNVDGIGLGDAISVVKCLYVYEHVRCTAHWHSFRRLWWLRYTDCLGQLSKLTSYP